MQTAVTIEHRGLTMRGMAHMPAMEPGGTVPAVILFHGFTGTKLEPHRMFLKISRALERLGIASFRFDFLGSGESDGDFEEMTLSREVDEANAVLEYVLAHPRVNRARVSLLGLSMGGLVASLLAGDRPEDIHQLGLIAPASSMPQLVQNMVRSMDVTRSQTSFDHGGNVVGLPFAEDLVDLVVYPRAAQFPGDVLLIHGTADETVSMAMSLEYQENAYQGRAEMHLIADADHTFNRHTWEVELIETVCHYFNR